MNNLTTFYFHDFVRSLYLNIYNLKFKQDTSRIRSRTHNRIYIVGILNIILPLCMQNNRMYDKLYISIKNCVIKK